MDIPTKNETETARPRRRKRRSRQDVEERICDAARHLFAERGYAATTTKEIARLADVSETLLFRYYGGKAALFDEVVSAPFDRLMREFMAKHPDLSDGETRTVDARRFVGQVYDLFDQNSGMFRALMAGGPESSGEAPVPLSHGLDAFFDQSVAQQNLLYQAEDKTPSLDLHIATRLGFGMIASGVLLRDWLFPGAAPSKAEIIAVLEQMVERALGPSEKDPPDRN